MFRYLYSGGKIFFRECPLYHKVSKSFNWPRHTLNHTIDIKNISTATMKGIQDDISKSKKNYIRPNKEPTESPFKTKFSNCIYKGLVVCAKVWSFLILTSINF